MATTRKTTKTPAAGSADEDDAIESFFYGLDGRNEPPLGRFKGTIRFDVGSGTELVHWYVAIDAGDITVSHRNARADSVILIGHEDCEAIVTGRMNAMAAVLRGLIVPAGDFSLIVLFQRVFPGPAPAVARALIAKS